MFVHGILESFKDRRYWRCSAYLGASFACASALWFWFLCISPYDFVTSFPPYVPLVHLQSSIFSPRECTQNLYSYNAWKFPPPPLFFLFRLLLLLPCHLSISSHAYSVKTFENEQKQDACFLLSVHHNCCHGTTMI